MRWIVCGGRRERLGVMGRAALAAIHRPEAHAWLGGLLRRLQAIEPRVRPGISAVYEGEADGVDKDAREAARALGIPVVRFPITDDDWAQHGKGAGPRRNRDMLLGYTRTAPIEPADAVFAERGGDGTANMVKQARAAGLPVLDLADPAVAAALAPFQRWTKDDSWLVRSDRRRCLEVQSTRPGVGPPIVSGHWLKVKGRVILPTHCLYVGRDAHGLRAHPRLHNPFPVQPLGGDEVLVHLPDGPRRASRAEALGFYRAHLDDLARDPEVQRELAAIVLQRRILVCWCGDTKPCHACVIAERAVELVAGGCFEIARRVSTAAAAGATAPT